MTEYVTARTLDQVWEQLDRGAKIIAGGTDLMVDLRRGNLSGDRPPEVLLDITRLPELTRLEVTGATRYVGASVTFRRLETDEAVSVHYPLLSMAAATVGSVQIRHLATIGGNAANASPAADGLTALAALGARAEVASSRGVRYVGLEDLITAPNQTLLSPDELILGFSLDQPPDPRGQLFRKIGRRKAMVIARMNLAVCLDRDLSDPRVVLGACFPSPRRLTEVEQLLASGSPGPDLWKEAGRLAADRFVHVCGRRSSAGYKVPTIARFVAATVESAWLKTGGRE